MLSCTLGSALLMIVPVFSSSFASPPPMFPPSAVYRVPPASALYRASQIETIEILERAMQRQSELTERLLRRHMY